MNDDSALKVVLDYPPSSTTAQFKVERDRGCHASVLIDEIEDLYNKKLYHQLTNKIESYITSGVVKNPVEQAVFLYNIVFSLKHKLNPLRIIFFLRVVADELSQYSTDTIFFVQNFLDAEDALLLVVAFETAFIDLSDAKTSLEILKSNIFIRAGKLAEAADLLFTVLTPRLNAEIGVDLSINSAFYLACVNYFRATEDDKEFYESLLLYLAYTPLNTISEIKRAEMAFELCVSGLLAHGMFDFGDLRAAPILSCLHHHADKSWILEFVDAAVQGDLHMFYAVSLKYSEQMKEIFEEKNKLKLLKEKMILASLIELAFQQPKTNRKLSLEQIALHCVIPLDECERLVMRAMSLEVIKGTIDNITSEVTVTWVKPRLVDMERIGVVKSRFVEWTDNIRQLITKLEDVTPDLLVS